MTETSRFLSLPYLMPAQAQKHVTHNEALRRLDRLVQLSVLSITVSAPPSDPADGDRYIAATGSTGDWAGRDGEVLEFEAGAWLSLVPKAGWIAWVVDEGDLRIHDGGAWITPAPALQNLPGVGIGATSDAVNKLSVASEATLLTHDGAGHQVKINKAAAADTASLLFQTNWSGRAEMGTAGGDDFAVKVSADGAAWQTGLSVEAATGTVTLGAPLQLAATAKADLPASPGTGMVAFVTDAAGGAALSYYDGSDWRAVRNDALI